MTSLLNKHLGLACGIGESGSRNSRSFQSLHHFKAGASRGSVSGRVDPRRPSVEQKVSGLGGVADVMNRPSSVAQHDGNGFFEPTAVHDATPHNATRAIQFEWAEMVA